MVRCTRQFFVASTRALTLGEMLFVAAVFGFLAAMFILSSQFAIVRSKVTRVMQDQRQVTRMLDQYEIEYLRLPKESDGLVALINDSHGASYLSTLPVDPFAQSSPTAPPYFNYFTNFNNQIQCLVVSIGPDGKADVGPAIASLRKQAVLSGVGALGATTTGNTGILFKDAADAKDFIARYSYDPTNGSTSRGDIIQPYFGGLSAN